ncbi:CDGSH iron sulfur domain-containing protein 2 [Zostera marina]|uniref:CDGSH iron sulfur domain-containing protein 2 n=1 Tax=Zostera marina TaxID=29655 RepID=A0A0K9PC99_ZOSMR|nr:CDGSH iron sulfur domain-containing protein 2 [Zostera marina]
MASWMASSIASKAMEGRACVSYSPMAVGRSYSQAGISHPSWLTVNKKRNFTVKATGAINPSIRKEEAKVVDAVEVTQLQKPITAYCRCWKSETFPLCDGTHVKHNKEFGDNVGPLVLKKPKE